MYGGNVVVDGPTNSANGALDCNGEFLIDGGYLVAVGASGMAESPDSGSEQASVSLTIGSMSAGTEIVIEDEDGDEILEFESAKSFSNIVFSSEDLEVGDAYTVYVDGESAGSFTLSSTSSSLTNGASSSTGMAGGMPGGGMGGRQGGMRR